MYSHPSRIRFLLGAVVHLAGDWTPPFYNRLLLGKWALLVCSSSESRQVLLWAFLREPRRTSKPQSRGCGFSTCSTTGLQSRYTSQKDRAEKSARERGLKKAKRKVLSPSAAGKNQLPPVTREEAETLDPPSGDRSLAALFEAVPKFAHLI